ncbi:MAG TPA: VWA domain-containing protein [Rhizobiaceae bacterium]|nr:VWA domain-containing protein [Rhizobiaceae bacterium]
MYQLDYPWLLIVLPLPFLVWRLVPPYREETASVRIPFFDEVAAAAGLVPTQGSVVPRKTWAQILLAPICWVLVVLALARPQFVEPPIEKVEPQRDLMLSLDLSQSMDTKDFRAPGGEMVTRVAAVREVVSDFVKRRQGDRIGLIAFGDAPYPLVPFTLDHDTVETMIAGVLPGMAGPRTALGDSIGLAIKMLAGSKTPEKVLVVLTDGNDTASKMPPDRAADIANQNGIMIHTVGIGDPTATGEDKVDVAALQKIASATGGRYFFGQDQNQLAEIYATLDKITPVKQTTLSWRPRIELFQYPLGAALLLLIGYHVLAWSSTGLKRVSAGREEGRT